MAPIDSENVDKFEVFVVLMQFLYNFREPFVISSNIVEKKERKLCSKIIEEHCAAFCFKNTSELLQMSRKIEKVQHLRFYATYMYFLNSQNVGKRSTMIKLIIQ